MGYNNSIKNLPQNTLKLLLDRLKSGSEEPEIKLLVEKLQTNLINI